MRDVSGCMNKKGGFNGIQDLWLEMKSTRTRSWSINRCICIASRRIETTIKCGTERALPGESHLKRFEGRCGRKREPNNCTPYYSPLGNVLITFSSKAFMWRVSCSSPAGLWVFDIMLTIPNSPSAECVEYRIENARVSTGRWTQIFANNNDPTLLNDVAITISVRPRKKFPDTEWWYSCSSLSCLSAQEAYRSRGV